jgi:hypothetical protein
VSISETRGELTKHKVQRTKYKTKMSRAKQRGTS